MTPEPIRRVSPHATRRALASGPARAVDGSAAFRAPSQRLLVEWSLLLHSGRKKVRAR
jgi:hypothetical protein